MDVRMLEKDSTKLSFMVKGMTPAYANTLRRVMVNRVPVLAIETVEFKKNSSALYDEQVAHRLGLIPLVTDSKSYVVKSECKCEGKGCAQCELKFSLKAKGPGIVLSSELKSDDPKVKPAYPNIPIAKLLKGQELEFTATAEMGEGRTHAKWAPGLTYYRFRPEIEITKKGEACEACARVCPVKVFDFDKKLKINQDNLLKCTLCMACVEESDGAVSVSCDTSAFIFLIESWGQLDCRKIVAGGVEKLNSILDGFAKEVKSTLS